MLHESFAVTLQCFFSTKQVFLKQFLYVAPKRTLL